MAGFANIFWGEIVGESKDKGPYRLVRVKADDHEFTATVLEPSGFHGSPLKSGKVMVALPDGDMGRATVIGGIPPKDRWDGLKPGEVGVKNHKSGIELHLGDDGTLSLKATKFVIQADVEITGNITHTGNYDQSGVHVDNNGPHTA
mgnify:CR=1 FL=1